MNQDLPLGALVHQQRKRLGFSTYQVAHAVGTTDTTILRMEKNQILAPRPDLLARLAELFDLSVLDVFVSAGYLERNSIPSFESYLNSKFPQLPWLAVTELVEHCNALVARYLGSAHPATHDELANDSQFHAEVEAAGQVRPEAVSPYPRTVFPTQELNDDLAGAAA